MCPAKEDGLVPSLEGQEAALKEEKSEITFADFLLSTSYRAVRHLFTLAIH